MRSSEFEGSGVHICHRNGICLGNTPQGIISEAAAPLPWLHDAAVDAVYLVLRSGTAMTAIGAGRFDIPPKQHD